jgi:hypothetical protein
MGSTKWAIALAATALTSLSSVAAAQTTRTFVTEPSLEPPRVTVTHPAEQVAPGLLFVANFDFNSVATQKPSEAQAGPLILDNKGQPVWYQPIPADLQAFNADVQTLGGKQVLTWWEGGLSQIGTPKSGTHYILGSDYRPVPGYVKSITGANGWSLSPHEFLITKRGTALTTAYKVTGGVDLTAFGGPADGSVWDNAVQEYDLKTGKLVFEWSMLGKLPLGDSATRPAGGNPWDAYHLNSIDEDPAGNLLVSNRNTSSVHKVVRGTGAVEWTLGGNSTNFAQAPDAQFAWQHDVRFLPDNQIGMFDNECCGRKPDGSTVPPVYQPQSRGLTLRLDVPAHTASMVREYKSPGRISGTQANVQHLSNGNVLIGWGQQPFISEFSEAGRLLFEAKFEGSAISYRAKRHRWTGRPKTRPVLAVKRSGSSRTQLRMSWNGGTDVARWRIRAGNSRTKLKTVRNATRTGFETAVTVRNKSRYWRVEARTAKGSVLARSAIIRRTASTRFRFSPDY